MYKGGKDSRLPWNNIAIGFGLLSSAVVVVTLVAVKIDIIRYYPTVWRKSVPRGLIHQTVGW